MIRLFTLMILLVLLGIVPAAAQVNQCGIAETINYPIDTNRFQLVQDFGVASPRHQGRLHTGEDWFGGIGSTLGQPVRAAAAGRVTFSSPRGWGRDGGVIIIQHTLPDESIIYTQYGHITESDLITFPTRLSCVEAGDLIGVIGDSRPAPHLHFEVRVGSPDNPGPGYSRENPLELEWRRPAQMIANLQTRLHRAYEWHVTTNTYGPEAPPLVLDNNALLVIDGNVLRRISPDGRVLWRVPVEQPAVSIDGFQANPLITYADGTLGRVDFEGNPGESWSLDFRPDMPPFFMGESPLYHTADQELVALTEDRRNFLWWVEDIPPHTRAHVSDSLIGVVAGSELWLITHEGEVLDRAQLRDGADMATYRDGSLVVYSMGGLWQIDESGVWAELIEDVPAGGGSGALAITADGRVFLTNGARVYAYSRLGDLEWEAELPFPIEGMTEMSHYDNILLLTSTYGDVVALRDTGGICGYTQLYGDDEAQQWHDLGDDDILRLGVGDQFLGLDWDGFVTGC